MPTGRYGGRRREPRSAGLKHRFQFRPGIGRCLRRDLPTPCRRTTHASPPPRRISRPPRPPDFETSGQKPRGCCQRNNKATGRGSQENHLRASLAGTTLNSRDFGTRLTFEARNLPKPWNGSRKTPTPPRLSWRGSIRSRRGAECCAGSVPVGIAGRTAARRHARWWSVAAPAGAWRPLD